MKDTYLRQLKNGGFDTEIKEIKNQAQLLTKTLSTEK